MTFTLRVINNTVYEALHLFWVQIGQTGFHLTSAQNMFQVTWNGWRLRKCSIQRRFPSLIHLNAVFRIALSQICVKISHKDMSLQSSHVPVKTLQNNLIFYGTSLHLQPFSCLDSISEHVFFLSFGATAPPSPSPIGPGPTHSRGF